MYILSIIIIKTKIKYLFIIFIIIVTIILIKTLSLIIINLIIFIVIKSIIKIVFTTFSFSIKPVYKLFFILYYRTSTFTSLLKP